MFRRLRARALDPLLLLVALLALFPIGPLFQPGYFWQAHDARHSVYFLFELDRGIQDGVWYPRWQPDFAFGYGYPFFNIYGPLSSYAGELFHLLGFGFADSVKIVFGLSVVASGLAMYAFVRRAVGRQAGLVAAVAYMVIPYHLVNLYVRAALAEAVAAVFIPLVLWGVWATLRRPRLANLLGLAVAYAALVVTHPLTALLMSLIVAAFALALAVARVNDALPRRSLSRESLLPWLGHLGHVLAPAAAGLLLGLGLSAFFILPAMTENRYVRLDQWVGGRYAWGGDFVELWQLFSPRWGFGVSVPGPDDGLSFQLGAVPAVLGLLALGRLAARRREAGPDAKQLAHLVLFFGALAAVAIGLMLSISAPLWAALPLARLTQFPWRLLGVTLLCLAFLCGAVAGRDRPTVRLPGFAPLLLAGLLILGSLPYMRAEMSEREVSLAELFKFQQSSDEMTGSTVWVRTIPRWSSMADYAVAGLPHTSKVDYSALYAQPGQVEARTVELHTDWELVEYLAENPILISFDRFYYPGWHAYLVDWQTGETLRELPISLRGDLAKITVSVPPGIARVLLRFEDTPLRKASVALSWASLALVGLLLAARARLRSGARRRAQPPGGHS